MLGLFKKKLNVPDHLDIINCLIIEEAEQQWNYHAVENNFDKEAFRGSSFAFGVVEMFVTKILKIKADDKVLMAIVQLGRDRCQEYITEHKDLKKQYEKLLPELLKKQERKKEKPKIRAFKGKKGIKELFYELLNTESKELFSQGAPIESTQIMGKTFWKNYGQKLKAKKLKIKIIYNESFREKLEDMKGLNAESRFTKKGFEPLTETFIVGDKVGIIIWTEEPLGILIQNKTAAESYKVFWEQNWNLAKE